VARAGEAAAAVAMVEEVLQLNAGRGACESEDGREGV
jgi:hypothetical protein